MKKTTLSGNYIGAALGDREPLLWAHCVACGVDAPQRLAIEPFGPAVIPNRESENKGAFKARSTYPDFPSGVC